MTGIMRIFLIFLPALCHVAQAQSLFGNRNPLGGFAKAAGSAAKVVPGGETFSSLVEGQWNDFLSKKNYSPSELLFRKNIFTDNVKLISDFAQQSASGAISFALKMNPLGDLKFDEFNKLFNGLKGLLIGSGPSKAAPYEPTEKGTLPESIDWREKGAVTSVKNQQQCAGCYAFSVAGALEGQSFLKSGKLEEVSIQNLLDCSKGKTYGNDGCQGGLVETAFDYVQDHGANGHSIYPYEAKDGSCRFNAENVVANCTGYVRIPTGDEKALAEALTTKGPISVAIHVADPVFQFYSKGVFYDPKCGNKEGDLNHAVLLVGYGKEANGQKYWLVKNSYGNEWGTDGYIKMAKDAGNHCGIATYARYPIV